MQGQNYEYWRRKVQSQDYNYMCDGPPHLIIKKFVTMLGLPNQTLELLNLFSDEPIDIWPPDGNVLIEKQGNTYHGLITTNQIVFAPDFNPESGFNVNIDNDVDTIILAFDVTQDNICQELSDYVNRLLELFDFALIYCIPINVPDGVVKGEITFSRLEMRPIIGVKLLNIYDENAKHLILENEEIDLYTVESYILRDLSSNSGKCSFRLNFEKATDLRVGDINGTSDPYVILKSYPKNAINKEKRKQFCRTRTHTVYNTLNPVWFGDPRSTLVLDIPNVDHAIARSKGIKIAVYDKDR
eukprot:TRINITY_DN1075_c0_g1_i5.p1 TRINITY_DN1075_c0_g1~~TRINITY_DN1075_c0_g1_i5.p1  ORF type:complete len:299 (-),score=45.58 TRINITY_DN1075_c0_g1_i5:269-1165(-)